MKISLTELEKILADRARIKALLAERAELKQQILDLLAGDAATLAKATAAFQKAEDLDAKARAGLPASS